MWQSIRFASFYDAAHECGVPEYAALDLLSEHLIEVAFEDLKSVGAEHLSLQRRRSLFAHGWQLSRVADEHQAAALGAVGILYEVVEQPAGAEGGAVVGAIAEHRSLVDDDERPAVLVIVQVELPQRSVERPLAIDFPMYGECLMAAVEREHFCGPACRSEQQRLALELAQRADDGAGQRGLARAG